MLKTNSTGIKLPQISLTKKTASSFLDRFEGKLNSVTKKGHVIECTQEVIKKTPQKPKYTIDIGPVKKRGLESSESSN